MLNWNQRKINNNEPLQWIIKKIKEDKNEKNKEYMNSEVLIPIYNTNVKRGYFIKRTFDEVEKTILNEGFYLNNSKKCMNDFITFCRKD